VAHQNTVFNQLFNFIPRHRFESAVRGAEADRYVKRFSAWQQLLVLLYAQITGKDSLREIESGLMTHSVRLYHLGLHGVARSTLSDAMKRRDACVFEALFYAILERAQALAPRHKFRFKNPLYTFDSTTVDLCLSTFDWARFRKQKGAIKLHCQLDHRGHLPVFVVMTDGKGHDLSVAREHFEICPDSIYCFDRAYLALKWLDSFEKQGAFFVTRAHHKQAYRVTGQHSQPPQKHVLSDEIIELEGFYSRRKYPRSLRLIAVYDAETDRTYQFLTNNFYLAASTIAEIYRQRWQVELFFKWIKQNLKIKTFLGTSRNAVLAQVWVAMIYYLLLAYIKFLSRVKHSITELSRRIREAIMHRLDLLELLAVHRIPRYDRFSDLYEQQLCLLI
jgi:hypothetical protein